MKLVKQIELKNEKLRNYGPHKIYKDSRMEENSDGMVTKRTDVKSAPSKQGENWP